jgi:tRNA/rRNA methyltransferase
MSVKNLSVVLVRAENPANMGHVARALKNFGVRKLVLVACTPHQVNPAYTTGWKAREILDKAKCYQNLKQALKPFAFAIGFSTRVGKRRGESIFLNELKPILIHKLKNKKVALVFGNEKNGLSNEELRACHQIATIPTASEYASLNLSHAVSIVLSNFYIADTKQKRFEKPDRYQVKPAELDALIDDFRIVMKRIGYKNTASRKLLTQVSGQMEHYFKKGGLERRELHLFKSFLSRIKERLP